MILDRKNLDLPLLIKQKQALLRAIAAAPNLKDAHYLDGILSLLDIIHDGIDPPQLLPKPRAPVIRR
jgi:hypothetical protein